MKNQDRPWNKIGAFTNFGAFTWEFSRGAWEKMGKTFEEKGLTTAQLSGDLLDEILERPEIIPGMRKKLAAHGVAVAALGAYRNLVTIHEKRRQDNIAYIERCLEIAGDLGNPVVATETGTRNPEGDWSDAPENNSLSALESLHRALERLVKVAEKYNSILALEGYVNNVIKTPARMEEIIQHYHSPNLKVVCDPYNYITKDLIPVAEEVSQTFFVKFQQDFVIAHFKDVSQEGAEKDTPEFGTGIFPQAVYLKFLNDHRPVLPLVFEHLPFDHIPAATERLRRIVSQLN